MSKLKKLITKKYIMALLAIALLDSLSFSSLLVAINKNKSFAYLVNISGKQRMLSKEITLFIHQLQLPTFAENSVQIRKDAQDRIELFSKRHLILAAKQKASDQLKIPDSVLHYFFKQDHFDEKIKKFIKQSNQYLKTAPSQEQLRAYSEFVRVPLFLGLEHVVELFESESNSLNRILVNIEIFIYLLSLVNLAFILKFIFIPMRNEILEREAELSLMVSKLKEEGQYKSMFLANMSHELRTPLNGILGVIDLVYDSPISEEQKEYIKIIEESGNSLLYIVNDILDLTKLEMGQVSLDNRNFSSEEFFSKLIQFYKAQAKKKHLDFDWIYKDLPLMIYGDEHKIKQVLNNILANAFKFTSQGSVKVVSSFEGSTSTLITKVHDTGIGISEKKLHDIFEPFKQADPTTTRKYGGTGLGLSISKRFVESMGGNLEVISQPNIGSTFIISIPCRDKA